MGNTLNAGESLEPTQFLESTNKKFKLQIQRSGALKLFRFEPSGPVPMGSISSYGVGHDGELRVSDRGYLCGMTNWGNRGELRCTWSRPANGIGPDYLNARLVLKDDGNLALYGRARRQSPPYDLMPESTQWRSGTSGPYRRAMNPEYLVVVLSNGSLNVNDNANTFIRTERHTVNVTDGDQTKELRRGQQFVANVPGGPGRLEMLTEFAATHTVDDGGEGDAPTAYQPDSVMQRSRDTWTVQPFGNWLVEPESLGGIEPPQLEDGEFVEMNLPEVDRGFTAEDKARVNGELPPIEFEDGK